MHIKQIIIQGFKSYKDQTVVDPFSPKHNVIVGRNGSGKSNFFAAIRFVLGDQYTQMGREERSALLHEGAGSAVLSAYVEIIFDNSEDRFPTNTPEVILRRSIGQKKDEYTLNRKNTTKIEVQNLLESAGFSKSNPYYIVPQGRITHITNMKDSERLDMLKEVAGTQVYEQRRAQSLQTLETTAKLRKEADDVLEAIRERLQELEEEKNELREYQEADGERRCLENIIYNREAEACREVLSKLVNDREGGVEQTKQSQDLLQEAEKQLESLQAEIDKLQQNLKLLNSEKAQFEQDRNDAAKEKAAIEYELQTLLQGQEASQRNHREQQAELKSIQTTIKQRESELASIRPAFATKSEQARQLRQQIEEASSTQRILLGKQGRSERYQGKRERDDDLRQKVAEVNKQLRSRQTQTTATGQEVQQLEDQIQQIDADLDNTRARLQGRGGEQQEITAQTQIFKDEKAKLLEQRTELWREQSRNNIALEEARRESENAERTLGQMMDRDTARGLAAIRRYVQQYDIEGVYGTVGELMEFSSKFKTAVEVVAGTSLFHVIVDTDATATRLVDLLQKERSGRITFMPLNRLHPKAIDVPNGQDAIPLLSKLRFDETFTKAYEQIFGKTVVCPDLKVASHYARSHGVSAITPGGDRSNKKGALSGGYHDTRTSRVDGLRRAKTARENLEQFTEQQAELRTQLDALEQRVTRAESELQKIEHQRRQAENGFLPLRQQLRTLEQDSSSKSFELDRKRRQLDNLTTDCTQLRQQLDVYQQELGSAFTKSLTDQEEQQLQAANQALPALHAQNNQVSNALSEIEQRKNDIELELRENLRPRLDQLQAQVIEETTTGESTSVTGRQKDLDRATKKVSACTKRLQQQLASIETNKEQLTAAFESQTEQQTVAEDMQRSIANSTKSLAKSAQKRRRLQDRLDEVERSIQALGALPDAAHREPYLSMTDQRATSRLHKVQDSLKKFGHVNKKAFEQFTQSNQKRMDLEQKQADLSSGDVSIRNLIDHLDQQKDEAIERTFRQVSKHFAEMFEKLVPAGKGRLIIQRRADRVQANGDGSDNEDEPDRSGVVENYTGVGISVSFNSKHDEQQRIQQLSGGQKSLCALTLIFAIQASDPAPFYLFDEIDANLDAQYRTAVANLIKESASGGQSANSQRAAGGQFICTTFRPEMLRVADKCYGVSSQAKASFIKPVEREEALEFVEGQVAATS